MKKNLKIFGIFIFLGIIFSLFFCFNFSSFNVKASESSPEITKTNYKDYDFDESLFQAVYAMAKQLNCNQTLIGLGFDTNLFLKNINTSYSPSYVETGVDDPDYEENINSRNEIVNDLKLGVLNLTTGKNAKYDCLKNIKSPIKNITGLNSLNLGFVKKLYLNDNEISNISSSDFDSMLNIQELYCSNNVLSTFSLNTKITNLNVLNLSSNFLNTVDLSLLKANSNVDLSNNLIKSTNDIEFLKNNNKLNSLDLNFNQMNDLEDENISLLQSKVLTSLNIGVQGLKTNEATAGDVLKIYNSNLVGLTNLTAQISYFEGSEEESKSQFYKEGENNIICSSVVSEEEDIYLPAGKIKIVFLSNGVLVDTNLHPEYKEEVLSVKLPNLNYQIIKNGKETKETYHEDNFSVEFYFEENENIPNLEDVLENAKIYSTVNKNSAQENNLINITSNGTFDVEAYVSFDGINSFSTKASVSRRYVRGIVLGIVIIITIIVIAGAGYFIVRWYRGGAMVAPLSEKELASLNRKKAKQQEEIRETLVRGSGKERFFERKEDEDVLSNLNSKREVGSYYNANEKGDYDESNYSEPYRSVGNNFDRYNTEEYKNDFEDENLNEDNEAPNDFDDDTRG